MPARRRLRYKGLSPFLRAGIILFFLVVALYFFSQSKLFAINKVEVQGNSMVSAGEVRALAAIPDGQNLWRLEVHPARRRVSSHPLLKSVIVSRRIPSTVLIQVKERQAVALLPIQDGFIILDENGVYMDKTQKITGFNLPVLSGLSPNTLLARGDKLEAAGLTQALEVARQLPTGLQKVVSEIRVASAGHVSLFLVGGVEARLGEPDRLPEKMALLTQVKESLSLQGKWSGLGYIDLSYKGYPVIH